MKYVAYHRTSTKDQHLDRGITEISKFCSDNNIPLYKDKVYTDQQTGKTFDRPRYQMIKEEMQKHLTNLKTMVIFLSI